MIQPIEMLLVLLLTGASDCEPPASGDRSICKFSGHCFDLKVDGQPAVLVLDGAWTEQFDGVPSQSVCWRLEEPISGALDATVASNAWTVTELGPLFDEVEIVVFPLSGQEIPTRKAIRTDPTVRIGGVAMQTTVDVIDLAALPNGPYVATFRARGPAGWDRKAVYLEVTREEEVAPGTLRK